MARKSTAFKGTCGACGGIYCVQRDQGGVFVAKHGFRKPRGYHVGRCSGAEQLPHELWPSVAVEERESLIAAIEATKREISACEQGGYPEVIEFVPRYGAWKREPERYPRDHPQRKYAEERFLINLQNRLHQLEVGLRECDMRIRDWQQSELIGRRPRPELKSA